MLTRRLLFDFVNGDTGAAVFGVQCSLADRKWSSWTGSPNKPTWFPAHRSFLAAAEADFAEDVEDVALAQRPRVFSRAGAPLVGGDLLAVGLSGLTLLSDQGAGDGRRHLPERWAEPPRDECLLTMEVQSAQTHGSEHMSER